MEITSELQLTLSFRLAMVFEYRSTYQAQDLLTVHRVLGQKASLSSVLLYLSTVVLASRFCSFVACMQGSFASVAAFLEYKEVICLVSKRYSETGPIKSQAPLNSMSGQIGKIQFRLIKQMHVMLVQIPPKPSLKRWAAVFSQRQSARLAPSCDRGFNSCWMLGFFFSFHLLARLFIGSFCVF